MKIQKQSIKKNLQIGSLSPKTNLSGHTLPCYPHEFNNECIATWLEEIPNHCPPLLQLLKTQAQLRGTGCYAAPRPMHRERMGAALKMKAVPQGRSSKQKQKGTHCKPGPEIRVPPHFLGLLKQVIKFKSPYLSLKCLKMIHRRMGVALKTMSQIESIRRTIAVPDQEEKTHN